MRPRFRYPFPTLGHLSLALPALQVSVLAFGGAEIGSERATAEMVDVLLNSALDAGLNLIDTAECYEASEELIGKVASGRRDEFFLFTQV